MLLENLVPHVLDVWSKLEKTDQIQAVGKSMSPLIGPQNTLQVVYSASLKLKPGDIVIFRIRSGLVAHRLIYRQVINNRIFWAEKGDNSTRLSFIPQASIICKVRQIEGVQGVRWVDKGWGRFTNRLIGVYWRWIISLSLLNKQAKKPQLKHQRLLKPWWLVSSKFDLQYIPRLLIRLNLYRMGQSYEAPTA
jgi:hypothetical protein